MASPLSTAEVKRLLHDTAQVYAATADGALEPIAEAARTMAEALKAGRKILWFGNGGSATQSQHMAAEFVGRFAKERRALPSIALTGNIANLTAIANDYSYEQVFSRQVEALGQPGDVAVGISTSGSSPNVVAALRAARQQRLTTIGLSRAVGGTMREACDIYLGVPSTVTARIQEVHLTIGHILCGLVEDALA
ncbi:MAG: D-sedoheptulose 7-phosphate isomerase [Candidatus Omnitrophica bacterium]|nr:D-sedoheptulose 7-phosphate isomerase [Candidatus Omnitrophota bacterium]